MAESGDCVTGIPRWLITDDYFGLNSCIFSRHLFGHLDRCLVRSDDVGLEFVLYHWRPISDRKVVASGAYFWVRFWLG